MEWKLNNQGKIRGGLSLVVLVRLWYGTVFGTFWYTQVFTVVCLGVDNYPFTCSYVYVMVYANACFFYASAFLVDTNIPLMFSQLCDKVHINVCLCERKFTVRSAQVYTIVCFSCVGKLAGKYHT